MDSGERLKLEIDLFREFRLWYNPNYITEEQLRKNIETQEGIIEMFRDSFELEQNDNTADIIISEVMKLELWKDILNTRSIQLEDN